MAKKPYLFQPKFTFLQFNIKLLLPQDLEDNFKMIFMIFPILDQNIIDKYHHKLIKIWLEH